MAVLACHDAAEGAAIFKVPHHGSKNADCPDVWAKMLVGEPIAILTPFSGGKRLPQNTDLKRLAKRTSDLYCRARAAPKPHSRSSMVEKKARQVARERHIIEGSPGHVRIRWSLTDKAAKPNVELFSGAYDVNRDSTTAA